MKPLFAFAMAGLLLLYAATAAAAPTDMITYFLVATGQCGMGGTVSYSLAKNDTDGQPQNVDNCGMRNPTGVLGGGFDLSFPGNDTLNATLATGSKAEAHVFVSTDQPDTVSVSIGVRLDKATCDGTSAPQLLTNALLVGDWTEFVVPCTFAGTAPHNATPSLGVTVHANITWFVGYAGDHNSRIDFLGFQPAPPPANRTGNETPPPEERTPAPPLPIVLGGLLVAGAAWRRRLA